VPSAEPAKAEAPKTIDEAFKANLKGVEKAMDDAMEEFRRTGDINVVGQAYVRGRRLLRGFVAEMIAEERRDEHEERRHKL